jgi:hypothetical protein
MHRFKIRTTLASGRVDLPKRDRVTSPADKSIGALNFLKKPVPSKDLPTVNVHIGISAFASMPRPTPNLINTHDPLMVLPRQRTVSSLKTLVPLTMIAESKLQLCRVRDGEYPQCIPIDVPQD